jgi:hypothetical protein
VATVGGVKLRVLAGVAFLYWFKAVPSALVMTATLVGVALVFAVEPTPAARVAKPAA